MTPEKPRGDFSLSTLVGDCYQFEFYEGIWSCVPGALELLFAVCIGSNSLIGDALASCGAELYGVNLSLYYS